MLASILVLQMAFIGVEGARRHYNSLFTIARVFFRCNNREVKGLRVRDDLISLDQIFCNGELFQCRLGGLRPANMARATFLGTVESDRGYPHMTIRRPVAANATRRDPTWARGITLNRCPGVLLSPINTSANYSM